MPKNKSNKQKCLDMWLWLRRNPGKWKSDYRDYLRSIDRYCDFESCWACTHVKENVIVAVLNKVSMCDTCPIDWGDGGETKTCEEDGTCYDTLCNLNRRGNPQRYMQAMDKMIDLIHGWKEGGHFVKN